VDTLEVRILDADGITWVDAVDLELQGAERGSAVSIGRSPEAQAKISLTDWGGFTQEGPEEGWGA
jgi:hypothetical protein